MSYKFEVFIYAIFLSLNATFLLIILKYLIISTFAVGSSLVVHFVCYADCLK